MSVARHPDQRILAIDPSLRGTGFAVLEKVGGKVRAITYGTIKNAPKLLASGCLVAIHERYAARGVLTR